MINSNRLNPGLILLSLLVSTIVSILYYFFRPTPVSISEVTSFTPAAISDTTTLRGIVTKDSPPEESGDYYLQIPNQPAILLVSDQDLLNYLGSSVTVKGELTLSYDESPAIFTIDLINISN